MTCFWDSTLGIRLPHWCHLPNGSLRPPRFKGKGRNFHHLVGVAGNMTEECDGWWASLQTSLENVICHSLQVLTLYWRWTWHTVLSIYQVWSMVLSSLYTWSHCILRTFSVSMRQLLSLYSYKSGGDCGSERASNLPQVTQLASGGPEIWTQAYMSLAACFMPFWFGVCSVTQSCLTLCDPMAYSPPGSSAVLPTTSFYLFHSVPTLLVLEKFFCFSQKALGIPWRSSGSDSVHESQGPGFNPWLGN